MHANFVGQSSTKMRSLPLPPPAGPRLRAPECNITGRGVIFVADFLQIPTEIISSALMLGALKVA